MGFCNRLQRRLYWITGSSLPEIDIVEKLFCTNVLVAIDKFLYVFRKSVNQTNTEACPTDNKQQYGLI